MLTKWPVVAGIAFIALLMVFAIPMGFTSAVQHETSLQPAFTSPNSVVASIGGYSPYTLTVTAGDTLFGANFPTNAEPTDAQGNSWTGVTINNANNLRVGTATASASGSDTLYGTYSGWPGWFMETVPTTVLASGDGNPATPAPLSVAAVAFFTAYGQLGCPTSGAGWPLAYGAGNNCGLGIGYYVSVWAQNVSAGTSPTLSMNGTTNANDMGWWEIPAIVLPSPPVNLEATAAPCGSGGCNAWLTWLEPTPDLPVVNITIAIGTGASSPLVLNAGTHTVSCEGPSLYCGNESGDTIGTAYLNGLLYGTTYFVQAEAWSAYGNSTWSNLAAFTTPPLPIYDANLEAVYEPVGGTILTWTEPSGVTVLNVTIAVATSFPPSLPANHPTLYSCLVIGCADTAGMGGGEVGGLAPSTTYFFQIEVWTAFGNSSWSNVAVVAVPFYSFQPVILSATAQGPTAMFVSWTDAYNTTNFTVAVGNASNPHLAPLEDISCAVAHCGERGSFFWLTITGLTNDTFYFVQVEAWHGLANSTWSNTVEVQTGQFVAPPVVAPPVPLAINWFLFLVLAVAALSIVIVIAELSGKPKRKP